MLVNIYFEKPFPMRLKPADKAKIKNRIRGGAAGLFRKFGPHEVNIDQIMETAGLTRGAYYAHFASKTDLLAQVTRHEHPLLNMLKSRPGTTSGELWQQMLEIFDNYLTHDHLPEILAGCSLASLTETASRADGSVKQGFQAAWCEIRGEMARGQSFASRSAPMALDNALLLATNAVTTAGATDSPRLQQRILHSAKQGFSQFMAQAQPNSEQPGPAQPQKEVAQ